MVPLSKSGVVKATAGSNPALSARETVAEQGVSACDAFEARLESPVSVPVSVSVALWDVSLASRHRQLDKPEIASERVDGLERAPRFGVRVGVDAQFVR